MTISPRYDQYRDAWDTCVLVEVFFVIVLLCLRDTTFCDLSILAYPFQDLGLFLQI